MLLKAIQALVLPKSTCILMAALAVWAAYVVLKPTQPVMTARQERMAGVASRAKVNTERIEANGEEIVRRLLPPSGSVEQGGWPPVRGLLCWIAFTLALPLVTYPLTKRVILGDSNAAILAMLVGYALLSVLVAYAVLLNGAEGWLGALGLLMTFGLALFYMYRAFSSIKMLNE